MDPYAGSSNQSGAWYPNKGKKVHRSPMPQPPSYTPTNSGGSPQRTTNVHARQRHNQYNQRADAFNVASAAAPRQFHSSVNQGPLNSDYRGGTFANNSNRSQNNATDFIGAAIPGGSKMFENPMAQAGVNYLQNGVKEKMASYTPGLTDFHSRLKYHFDVDHNYVLMKLKLILFPKQVSWARKKVQREPTDANATMEPPRRDVNAPDLYIPLMSFVTYAIISSSSKRVNFTPEILWAVMSLSLAVQALQCIILRLGFHLHRASVSIVDLIAYTGYAYVGLCLNTLAHECFGTFAFYLVLLWTSCALGYFYIKTLALPMFGTSDNSYAGNMGSYNSLHSKKSKQYFLFGFGLSQPLLMWWMCYTK
eukprot:GSMAST32.ASY1.ANO1.1448.1 assembled CDS